MKKKIALIIEKCCECPYCQNYSSDKWFDPKYGCTLGGFNIDLDTYDENRIHDRCQLEDAEEE